MITTNRARPTLIAIAAILFLVAALLWLVKPAVPSGSTAPASLTQPVPDSLELAAGDAADIEAIVNANIFSPARAAPRSRYDAAGDGFAEYSAPIPGNGAPAPSGDIFSPAPLLFGTMIGQGRPAALIQTDSVGASARLYHEGDRIGAYRLVRVLATSVIVSGPRGRLELRIRSKDTAPQ
ncbi:MAG: hypothetical protein H0W63_10005 [Gemmatimonadaceae bacterium]|nr:hypothetical protein [Gemmatimonadaceae bacterium]